LLVILVILFTILKAADFKIALMMYAVLNKQFEGSKLSLNVDKTNFESFSALPDHIKTLNHNIKLFRAALRHHLLPHSLNTAEKCILTENSAYCKSILCYALHNIHIK
jgi:hypothetical protein